MEHKHIAVIRAGKPRIKRAGGSFTRFYTCEGGKCVGIGAYPSAAYNNWALQVIAEWNRRVPTMLRPQPPVFDQLWPRWEITSGVVQ